MTEENRSPLISQSVHLFRGFNPPMVATCVRDTLRFLFELIDVEGLKYSNEDPKQSQIAIDLGFEANQEGPIGRVPKVVISRGGYQNSPVGLTGSYVDASYQQHDQRYQSRFVNVVNGQIDITVKAWNLGTCERLAYYVNVFLTWSRPQLCNTLGFKQLGAPISVSAPMPDKDEKECFIIQLAVPYVTEMIWYEREVGIKIRQFLAELDKQ